MSELNKTPNMDMATEAVGISSSNANREGFVSSSTSTTPKAITFVQNYVSPVNALYIFPVTISAILDLLSPFGSFLLMAAIATGLVFAFMSWRQIKLKKEHKLPFKKTTMVFALISFLIFSASAAANFAHGNNGILASWIPKIKTWQDAYIVSLKQDTEEIKKQNTENGKKIDKVNTLLAGLTDNLRFQLEQPLVEQIKGYNDLSQNQKDALVVFTSKVGVNGIKRYKGLLKAANQYTADKSDANAKALAQHFNYIVRINGKEIEDTKTKKLLMSLFLDPETYNYLMGEGKLPADTSLLKELNLNTTLAKAEPLADPLGDFIKQLETQGTPVDKKVVVPTLEVSTNGTTKGTDRATQIKNLKGFQTSYF